jgi:heme-degrading monooxygenase HmoA
MWVRIREVSCPPEAMDQVIGHVRNTAVVRNDGAGFRGFRLLVDRSKGRALEVSYWETEANALNGAGASEPTDIPHGNVERCDVYELAIDGG